VRKTDRTIEESAPEDDLSDEVPDDEESTLNMDETETKPVNTEVMEEMASFDHITLWDHDTLPDVKDNPYARGVEEWIEFASAVSSARCYSRV